LAILKGEHALAGDVVKVAISHLEAGGHIYIALNGSRITIDPHAQDDLGIPSLSTPRLAQFDPNSALDESGIDLFRLLRWDYSLVKRIYGRESDLSKILAWAEDNDNAATARLLSGLGGSGKTRLAGEVCKKLQDKGWTAGFIPFDFRARPFRITAGKGLFLVFDYPEERAEDAAWLLRVLADLVVAPCPIRVLFLSRRSFEDWSKEALVLEGRFGRQAISTLSDLSPQDARELIAEAATNFANLAKLPLPKMEFAETWINGSHINRTPLFATAAAIHAVLEPDAAFGLVSSELIRQLANRERRRVDKLSIELAFGDTGLANLLGLGILADGLDQIKVEALARAGATQCKSQVAIDGVTKTPWWREGKLTRLEPDKLAAAFLDAVFFPPNLPKGHSKLPCWLFEALSGCGRSLGDRLSRVLHDLIELRDSGQAGHHPLYASLIAMLDEDANAPLAFHLSFADFSIWTAPIALVVFTKAVSSTEEPVAKATFLGTLSSCLSVMGKKEEALTSVREAVALYKKLLPSKFSTPFRRSKPFDPLPYFGLAQALLSESHYLSELGRYSEALHSAEAAYKAVTNMLEAGKDEAITEAANVTSLVLCSGACRTRAEILVKMNAGRHALPFAEAAVDMLKAEGGNNPYIRSELAAALETLSQVLIAVGQVERGSATSEESKGLLVEVTEGDDSELVRTAMALLNHAASLAEAGDFALAVEPAQKSVNLFRTLAKASPIFGKPRLIGALMNVGTIFGRLGQSGEAIGYANEALALSRELAKDGHQNLSLLAECLHNCSPIFWELDRGDEAIAVGLEAVTTYRSLAQSQPHVFNLKLALSLNNAAKMISDVGRNDDAVPLAEEALSTILPYANYNPKAFRAQMSAIVRVYGKCLRRAGKDIPRDTYQQLVALAEKL
jgi:tetratricopeptide (TPR) repeat protein